MRQVNLPVPELGLISVTRGMLGAGAMLLFGSKIAESRRRAIGWPLFLAGVISTVPLAIDVIRRVREADGATRLS